MNLSKKRAGLLAGSLALAFGASVSPASAAPAPKALPAGVTFVYCSPATYITPYSGYYQACASFITSSNGQTIIHPYKCEIDNHMSVNLYWYRSAWIKNDGSATQNINPNVNVAPGTTYVKDCSTLNYWVYEWQGGTVRLSVQVPNGGTSGANVDSPK
jgi:hypothetical protein